MLELGDCLKTVVLTVNRKLGDLLNQWGYPVVYRQHDSTVAKIVVGELLSAKADSFLQARCWHKTSAPAGSLQAQIVGRLSKPAQ
jgi:hypothetical protein